MNRNVWALCALVALVSVAACDLQKQPPIRSSATAQAATPTANDAEMGRIEQELTDLTRFRDVNDGWAATVQTGDRRTTNEIGEMLAKLSVISKRLEALPNSDKVAKMRSDVAGFMVADCKVLLRKARSDQDIWVLSTFVRHAKTLDVSLQDNFGVTPENLRKEALVMARKEVVELRPEIAKDNGDAIGGLVNLYNEWGFTPAELGLNAVEMKLVRER
jgi:hypothetical protein